MNTDRKSGGTGPLILNVSNCDTMIVSKKMEEMQEEDSRCALRTAKMRVRRHSFKSQKS